MNKTMELDFKIKEMAARIKELREIMGFSLEYMAEKTGVSPEEYSLCEEGKSDLNFAFIYRCAGAFSVNVTDIIEGYSPKLSSYTVTRRGEGQEIAEAHGMTYYNLAHAFQNRIAEPLYVKMDYNPEAEQKEIELTSHSGQECDIIVEGNLLVQIGEHKIVLGAGDSIYYNSSVPHGMIAVEGEDCVFCAVVLPGEEVKEETVRRSIASAKASEKLVCEKFVETVEDVYLDSLVDVIDYRVEKVDNYKQKVEAEYSL